MRDWSQWARLAIALLAGQLAIATQASAESDMVVMPFRCDVVNGKPVLTPSDEEEGHRILGARETKKVQTCSTVDKKRCRQWTTFKFDIDCGGARVPWMQVFANASEHTRRRVWERDGRIRVRDTAMRNPRVDDMCARRMGPQLEWSSTSQLCDEVSTLTAPTATDMPAGFAPMIGLDAAILSAETFAKIAARYGRAETPATTAAFVPPAPEPKRAKSAEANVAPRSPPPAKVEPPAPAVAAPETPAASPTPVEHITAPAPTHAVTPKPETMAAADQPAERPSAPVEARRASPEPEPLPVQTARAETPVVLNAPAVSEPVAALPSAPEPNQQSQPDDAPPPEVAAAEADQDVAYLVMALASGLLMITLLVVHWLGNAKTAANAAQGAYSAAAGARPETSPPKAAIEKPSDPAANAAPSLAIPSNNAIVLTRSRQSENKTAVNPSTRLTANRPAIGDRMPSSKHEALQVLGMGVASDSNVTSLKKIIDGLRMNWHPDHAANETDRLTRELRLKQINAAWEILGGKGAEA